jgi:hypothetical protein
MFIRKYDVNKMVICKALKDEDQSLKIPSEKER